MQQKVTMPVMYCITGLLIFFVLASMLLMLPKQTHILRFLDAELHMVEQCEAGDAQACQALTASHDLTQRVSEGTSAIDGTCLYVSEHGLALRTRTGHVTDFKVKADVAFA